MAKKGRTAKVEAEQLTVHLTTPQAKGHLNNLELPPIRAELKLQHLELKLRRLQNW